MKAVDCKPGDHLYTMYSYDDDVLEVEVLPPLEPIYQDFVWCRFVQCPPGWKSPRNIRAKQLYPTKKDALKAAIEGLDDAIYERERKIDRLDEERQRLAEQQIKLLALYDKEAT